MNTGSLSRIYSFKLPNSSRDMKNDCLILPATTDWGEEKCNKPHLSLSESFHLVAPNNAFKSN